MSEYYASITEQKIIVVTDGRVRKQCQARRSPIWYLPSCSLCRDKEQNREFSGGSLFYSRLLGIYC
jgi:hypothetical protein